MLSSSTTIHVATILRTDRVRRLQLGIDLIQYMIIFCRICPTLWCAACKWVPDSSSSPSVQSTSVTVKHISSSTRYYSFVVITNSPSLGHPNTAHQLQCEQTFRFSMKGVAYKAISRYWNRTGLNYRTSESQKSDPFCSAE